MKHLGTRRMETDRLILRRFTLDDAEAMYKNWASDTEVTKFLMWPTHRSVEETKNVLADWVDSYDKEDKYEWCIAKKENDEPIGSIGVVKISERVNAMEIGYCISRNYWHQGITSEAMQAVMKYLLDEVGVDRIESRHDPRNQYSGAVMQKCGLKYEGTRVRADWNNSGICDTAMYGYVKGVTEDRMAEEVSESPKQPKQAAKAAADQTRKNVISDETIEYVGILAKLELNDEEKERAKKDMGEMLEYIDKLNDLDTTGIEPMSYVFPISNVFREDVVKKEDGSEAALLNAPEKKAGGFKVPKTIA